MSSIVFKRQWFTWRILGLLVLLVSGCGGEEKPGGPDPKSDVKQVDVAKIKAEIKELLPAAAGMPYREFELMATSGTAPSLESSDNQPLSLVVVALRSDQVDESVERLKAEFQYVSGPPKPSDFAEAMIVSRSKGYASVIQPDYIDEVTCEVQDGEASGKVTFTIKDCFKATVQFAAVKRDDKWQIIEFSLPAHQTRTVLGDDGKWKASGPGVTAPPVDVQLPLVVGLPSREDSPNRLVLYVGRSSGQDRDEYLVGLGEKKTSLAKAQDILTPALEKLYEQKTIAPSDVVCIIRADRRVPTGIVQLVMKQAMEAGIEQFRLQARVETDDQSFDPYPPIGEATFRLPQTGVEDKESERELLTPFEPLSPLDDMTSPPASIDPPPLESALPTFDDCQPNAEYLPPLRVRLKSAEDGSLIDIGVNQWVLGKDMSRLQQRLKEYVEVGAEAAVEIDVDFDLRYEDFMKAVAACSGYKQDDGKWVPLIGTLLLAPPRRPLD